MFSISGLLGAETEGEHADGLLVAGPLGLVVGEHGVQAGERAREIVVLRHAPFDKGVQHAVLFGDRNVLPRYIVQ